MISYSICSLFGLLISIVIAQGKVAEEELSHIFTLNFIRNESTYDGHDRETCINMVLLIGISEYIVKDLIKRILKISHCFKHCCLK